MSWIWPQVSSEASARRAVTSAAMLPLFGAAYLALLPLRHGSPITSLALSGLLISLSFAIHRGSRLAVIAMLGLLTLVAGWQRQLFLPWISIYLMFGYGLRGALALDQLEVRADGAEPYLSAIGNWLWPRLGSGAAAMRAVHRESLLVAWLAIEVAGIDWQSGHPTGAVVVAAIGAGLLIGLTRASRLAAVAALLLLGALGPIFLPLFPLRPQHWLALPLVIAGVRGAFAYHRLRRRDERTSPEDEEGPTEVDFVLADHERQETIVDEVVSLR